MRSAIRAFACAMVLVVAWCAPAVAAPANGQLAAVVDERLVTVNPDGSGLRSLPVAATGITELAWSPDGNRLAYVHAGRLAVYELATGRSTELTRGPDSANPAWSADGTRIGFRQGLATWTVASSGGAQQPHSLFLLTGTMQIAWAPDLSGAVAVIAGFLALGGLDLPPVVQGTPAWSPDGLRIAFANDGGLAAITVKDAVVVPVAGAPAQSPRWSPDSSALVYPAGTELRTVAADGGAPRTVLTAATRVAAADWQPCVADTTTSCVSARPPRCVTATASATTLTDQPVDLPGAPCNDPEGRQLSIVVKKLPDHGTLSGWRYTPSAGYFGQDTLDYRVSNGAHESELVRLTIVVAQRPASAPAPVVKPPVSVPLRRAPFLTARTVPRLDRRRRTLVQLSCDQDCSLTIRLTARLRSKKTITGPQVKRSLSARGVLKVRLRLPSSPRGTVRTVWITGRVRNAAGDVRAVRVPVRLPR